MHFRNETWIAFAQWLAATCTTSFGRYKISNVFQKTFGCGTPLGFFQADLNIVVPVLDWGIAEAKAMKVRSDVVALFADWDTCSVEVKLNHKGLLACI